MAKMGITMLEMYVDMIKEKFQPIFNELNLRESQLQEECRVQAKKELGIYDKMMRLEAIKLEMEEIKSQLLTYTEGNWVGNRHVNKIELLTERKMKLVRNGFHDKVQKTMDDMIFKLKLTGLDGDVKEAFETLPNIISKLCDECAKLPPVKEKIKLLQSKKNK